jgi:hypothetical protein
MHHYCFIFKQKIKDKVSLLKKKLSLFLLSILLNSQIENLESMTEKIFGIIIYL